MKLDSELVWCSNEACILGENPLWDADSSTLYWIDVVGPAVYACKNNKTRRYPMPRPVASAYLAGPEMLLVALRSRFVWLDLSTGEITEAGEDWPVSSNERFNDGRCDQRGTIWISTMDRHLKSQVGSIVRIASSTDAQAFGSRAVLGNGVCFSPNDRFLYFSDTYARAIFRYEKEKFASGAVPDRALFVDASNRSGKPDGSAMDIDGCLWSVYIGGGRIERYSPTGALVGYLDLPVSHPTHCTFGDTDLGTLFVTTARDPGISPSLIEQSMAGRVLAYKVGTQGLREQRLTADFGSNHAQ